MATTIRTIPILSGKTAERFIEMAEANEAQPKTVVPLELKTAISRMMQRSRNIIIKHPAKQ